MPPSIQTVARRPRCQGECIAAVERRALKFEKRGIESSQASESLTFQAQAPMAQMAEMDDRRCGGGDACGQSSARVTICAFFHCTASPLFSIQSMVPGDIF